MNAGITPRGTAQSFGRASRGWGSLFGTPRHWMLILLIPPLFATGVAYVATTWVPRPTVVEQSWLPSNPPIADLTAPGVGPAEEKLETGTANSSVESDPLNTTLQVEVPDEPLMSGPAIVVPSTSLSVGETASVTIELPGLTTGFAGYDILVTLEDITVAEIIDVSFPAFGLTQAIQPAPNQLRLRAATLGAGVDSGSDPMEMATLEILGKQDGTSDLSVTVNRLDDLAGDEIKVTIYEARVTVQTTPGG